MVRCGFLFLILGSENTSRDHTDCKYTGYFNCTHFQHRFYKNT